MKKPWHGQFKARPVIVTRGLEIIEKDTILRAAAAKGVKLEVPPTARRTEPKKLSLATVAEKCGIEGEYFRSRREAARFVFLKRQEEDGTVRGLERNPKFVLHCVNPQGLKVAIAEYTGDFRYWERLTPGMAAVDLFQEREGEQLVIEESKGFPTDDWELRRKWVEAEYGFKIRVT